MDKVKCTKCKVNLPQDHFREKRGGGYTKMCIRCLDTAKRNRDNNKCEHNKRRSVCKDCGGGEICEHNKIRSVCKDCGGGHICEHNKKRSVCKDCGGGHICEHNRRRSRCKECGGSSICEHNKIRSRCKDCGGSQICEHNKIRSRCKDCGGSQICEHKKRRSQCKECDFTGYLVSLTRDRVYKALKSKKEKSTFEYLGADIEQIKIQIESTFKDGMSWENQGDWHIDHIIPIKYKEDGKEPTHEEQVARLHYTNLQAMWGADNISKGNRFIG